MSNDFWVRCLEGEAEEIIVEIPLESLERHFPEQDDITKLMGLLDWCKENCKGYYDHRKMNSIAFENPDDAAFFKLSWC